MGAWIETVFSEDFTRFAPSPACMGAWIETLCTFLIIQLFLSPACMGAWIETVCLTHAFPNFSGRPLVWGRGLKRISFYFYSRLPSRPLVWGRGLKHYVISDFPDERPVARLYGGVD